MHRPPPRRRRHRRQRKPLLLWGVFAALLAVALGLTLWLLFARVAHPATPGGAHAFGTGDMVIHTARVGMTADQLGLTPLSVVNQPHQTLWMLDGATLTLTGTPPALSAATMQSDAWTGPMGIKVGDTLDTLLARLPVQSLEAESGDGNLLYTADAQGIAPVAPYGVLSVQSGQLMVTLVAERNDRGAYPYASIAADPDDNRITHIAWGFSVIPPELSE